MPETADRIESLFAGAVALTPEKRGAYRVTLVRTLTRVRMLRRSVRPRLSQATLVRSQFRTSTLFK